MSKRTTQSNIPASAVHLSILLANPIKPAYTTRLTKELVESSRPNLNSEAFVPFVRERDGLGRLLPIQSEPTLTKVKLKNKSVQIDLPSQRSNFAFNTTISKTTRRRNIDIFPRPPIGHYNPSDIRQVSKSHRQSVDLTNTGRLTLNHKKTTSVDLLDYDRLYAILERRVSTFNMQNQLAREKDDYDFDLERRELYRAPLVLPEYLKKFKGLYHVSKLKPEEANVIQQDTDDMRDKIFTIKDALLGLKDYGKRITKGMFKSKRSKH